MKKVLITGSNSYIGMSVEKWLKNKGHYMVETLDVKLDSWKKEDFSIYDCIYHVAGIVHKNDVSPEIYESVNHKLAVEIATKAMNEGVKQFIFMSSGAVYSQNDRKHKNIIVSETSKLEPCTDYGRSKLAAEDDIKLICKESAMKIVILRPPMVYGKGAKGNYNSLAKFALKYPIFPKLNNQRSMIYIDNLCEFVRLIIDSESEGVFLPQNKEYVNSSELVKLIANIHGKNVILTPIFNWALELAANHFDFINKVIGSYTYENKSEYFNGQYQIVGLEESIKMTEK